jgi:hypothetical protein
MEPLFDYGPGTGAPNGCWANVTSYTNFAESFTFSTATTVDRVRIWTCLEFRDTPVHLKILADAAGSPGAFLYEESRLPDSWVADIGSSSPYATHTITVSLAEPFRAAAGAKYWIGVSGETEIGQASLIGPGDGAMAQFDGRTFVSLPGIGDMMFQLLGPNAEPKEPNGVIHHASGGGTVDWFTGQKVTYGIAANQKADGTVEGQLLFNWHGGNQRFKGRVTCLNVVGNRAYLSGELTQTTPPFDYPYFAIGLEDNDDKGSTATADRVSGMILLATDLRCYPSFPIADWTHGNVQIR